MLLYRVTSTGQRFALHSHSFRQGSILWKPRGCFQSFGHWSAHSFPPQASPNLLTPVTNDRLPSQGQVPLTDLDIASLSPDVVPGEEATATASSGTDTPPPADDDTQTRLNQVVSDTIEKIEHVAHLHDILPDHSRFKQLTDPRDADTAWETYQSLSVEDKEELTVDEYNYLLWCQRFTSPGTMLHRRRLLFTALMSRADKERTLTATTTTTADDANEVETESVTEPCPDKGNISDATPLRPNLASFRLMLSTLTHHKQIPNAEQLFRSMTEWGVQPDQATYCILMNGHYQHSRPFLPKVVALFREMEAQGIVPDDLSYFIVIRACMSRYDLEQGQMFYKEMLTRGVQPTAAILAILATAFLQKGQVQRAQSYMAEIGQLKNNADRMAASRLWSTLFLVTRRTLSDQQLADLFVQMLRSGLYPSKLILHRLDMDPMEILELMQREQVKIHPSTYTTLLYNLLKLRDFRKASQILDHMRENKVEAHSYFYNALIDTFVHAGQMAPAFRLYDEMMAKNIQPNVATFTILLHGVTREGNLDGAVRLLSIMKEKKLMPTVDMYNAVLFHCGRLGRSELALQVHRQLLLDNLVPDIKTYEFILGAISRQQTHQRNGPQQPQRLWDLYTELHSFQLTPSNTIYHLLIPLLCRGQGFTLAWKLWQEMKASQIAPTTNLCNYLMISAEEVKDTDRVLEVWRAMVYHQVRRDPIAFKTFLTCCHRANLVETAQANLYDLLQSDHATWQLSAQNLLQLAATLALHQQWESFLTLVKRWGEFGVLMNTHTLKTILVLARNNDQSGKIVHQVAKITEEHYPETLV
ncbi:hypothetical protein IWQ62_000882 [Dispira parvispora]|uniref:Pentatricopeptide repeat-containing protein n=1 Tax=Dispira parvispora TaxID=1520584 RepID=A0A9W8AZP5_9FUNG|nr:hypothetical protein IWQ62_000882 [Dispira parvispora]